MPTEINSRLLVVCLLSSLLNQSESLDKVPTACRSGYEFWSIKKAACLECTKCAPEFTISPCAIYKDAICGPLSALELDWSFLNNNNNNKKINNINEKNNDIINNINNSNNNTVSDDMKSSEMLWQFSQPEKNPEALMQMNNGQIKNRNESNDENEFVNNKLLVSEVNDITKLNKNNHESINVAWDWQTSALVLAVCACIIFFVVAGCSAIIYVRQWRRMKRNFEPAGLEEISARLNLMVKAELAELNSGAPMNPGDPEVRCYYLEKLLDRKRDTRVVISTGWPEIGGNLYIEETAGEPSSLSPALPINKSKQFKQIQRNIQNIITHKSQFNC